MPGAVTSRRGKSGSSRFASIPSVSTPRSSFNRSHGHKTTFDGGFLIPICADEMLPGDTMKCRTSSFVRMLTPLTPIMDQMWLDTFWFFVPNRILWDNWVKFMGEEDDPGDSVDFLVPIVDFDPLVGGEFDESTIFDYMGIRPFVDFRDELINQISALHFRAYNLIYKTWFRPQDITDSPVIHKGDGPDPATDYTLLRRAKRHDYFTAALPFPQKGPAVSLSLGTSAPISGTITGGGVPTYIASGATSPVAGQFETGSGAANQGVSFAGSDAGVPGARSMEWFSPQLDATGLTADLSAATAATINAIREATTLQQFYERQARGGTRYTEQITSFFGVRSPDARLQRPEYLGGSSDALNVHPIAQTAQAFGGDPNPDGLGRLGSYVTGGSAGGRGFTYSATEHGVVLGLAMVRANLTYQQGLPRMWSRQTRFDFAWPIFSTLGEQEVLNKEIFVQSLAADNNVFGYQERYAEYRYAENRLSGLFRSDVATSLDVWHLAQDFTTLPALNDAFIEENPPFLRTVAVQDENIFKGDFWFDINHVRPLPVYSVPGLARF